MTDPQVNNVELIVDTSLDTGVTGKQEVVGTTGPVTTSGPSLSGRILRAAGSAALHVAISSPGRRLILSGALYLAGGALISTVGVVPVALTALTIWAL